MPDAAEAAGHALLPSPEAHPKAAPLLGFGAVVGSPFLVHRREVLHRCGRRQEGGWGSST